MAVYVIRHGETAANAARVLQLPSTPLSERGLEQAERLARRLAGEGIRTILSSDLTRAVMTAEVLRAATEAELLFDPVLQERNFGDARGTPYDELGFDLFDPGYAPPGGEDWQVFCARVDRAWAAVERAAAATAGHLAVVTHGLVCRAFVERHIETAGRALEVPARPCGNTSVTVAEGPNPWRARLVNCCAHLEDEGRSAAEV